ncbi:hypothetical protein BGZ82_007516 [Podila clonocystis]|nr:hypothetical protein BGZ82_007516 [Podila clonocystis]
MTTQSAGSGTVSRSDRRTSEGRADASTAPITIPKTVTARSHSDGASTANNGADRNKESSASITRSGRNKPRKAAIKGTEHVGMAETISRISSSRKGSRQSVVVPPAEEDESIPTDSDSSSDESSTDEGEGEGQDEIQLMEATPEDTAAYVSTAKPRPPLTAQEIEDMKKNKVLIVGAGLGGITLGICLEKAGIPGSALAIGPNVLFAWKQLGIYDELIKLGKRMVTTTGYDDDLVAQGVTDWNIHMGKHVASIVQNEHSVTITCTDNTAYQGDILVGADGAYSRVRQSLYKQLKEQNALPECDDGACTCLVGHTEPLDPTLYPEVEEEDRRFSSIMDGKYPYSSFQGAFIRFTTKHMPVWLNRMALCEMVQNHPQLSFLPRAEDKGTIKALNQPSLNRKPAFPLPDKVAPAAV